MDTKKGCSMRLNDNTQKWIDEQIVKESFNNRSSAVRKCIRITRKIYEEGTDEEKLKYLIE